RRDPELRRRARRPGDAAPAFGECRLDDLSLGAWLLWEGRRRGDSWRPPARISGKPRWLDGKHATGAQDHGSLDDVLQLADVPRPIVGLQQVERLLVDGPERLAGLSAVALNEVFDQHQDVFPPLSERRHLDREYIEPIEQVRAEAPICHRRFQVTIRGGDDADVDVDRLPSPPPLESPLLQPPQQRRLRVGQELAHLIEEDRAAIGELETAKPALRGSGEGSLLVAEQLRRDQRWCNGRAVDADEGACGPPRSLVNGAGDELLAGSRLTRDEDGRSGGSDLGHLQENDLQCPRRADDFLEHRSAVDLVAQREVLPIELVLQRPDLAFPSLEIVVEPSILERNRRLGGQHLQ